MPSLAPDPVAKCLRPAPTPLFRPGPRTVSVRIGWWHACLRRGDGRDRKLGRDQDAHPVAPAPPTAATAPPTRQGSRARTTA